MSENVSNISSSYESQSKVKFYTLVIASVNSVISVIGLPFTIATVLIYSRKQFKEKMFVYLKLESLLMSIIQVITALGPIYHCDFCPASRSLFTVVQQLYLKIYLVSITEMGVLILATLAAVSFLQTVQLDASSQRLLKLITDRNPYLIFTIQLIVSAALFAYQMIQNEIIQPKTGEYYLTATDFDNTKLSEFLDIFSFALRDGVLLALFIFINVNIWTTVRRSLNNKMRIVKGDGKESEIRKSQSNLTKMMVVDSLLYVLSRLPVLVYFTLVSHVFNLYTPAAVNTVLMLIRVTYVIKFFVYYKFNKRFRCVVRESNVFVWMHQIFHSHSWSIRESASSTC